MNDTKFYTVVVTVLVTLATAASVALTIAGMDGERISWFVGMIMGLASLMMAQQKVSAQKMATEENLAGAQAGVQIYKDEKIQEAQESTEKVQSSLMSADGESGIRALALALRQVANLTKEDRDIQSADEAEKNLVEFERVKRVILEKQVMLPKRLGTTP